MNNKSARLIVNRMLVEQGWSAISADLDYQAFAGRLRSITARKSAQAEFVERSDAVAYIRLVAQGAVKIPQLAGLP
jgi:hypothetical protein